MVSGEITAARLMDTQCDARGWERCHTRQAKAECKQEEGNSLDSLDRVVLCAQARLLDATALDAVTTERGELRGVTHRG